MARRGITAREVTRTVRRPGQIVPSVKGREIYQSVIGRAGALLLRVVVKEAGSTYWVVTAYKTRKIAKYWRTP